jgi:hypothetical protein
MTQPPPIPFPPLKRPDAPDALHPPTEVAHSGASDPGGRATQAVVPAQPKRAIKAVSRLPLRVPVWPSGVD